ncbi:MAG: hypothetical protein ACPLKS_06145 [Caldisericum exile]|uniref:hypothetical protein n=1 Tax=Caldisericum exile TaxID=693075 RepID=UPI003C760409
MEISPVMTSRGETLTATAIAGEALKQMRIAREYGYDVAVNTLGNPSWKEDYTVFYDTKNISENKVVSANSISNDGNDTEQWTKVNTAPYLHDYDDSNVILSDAVTTGYFKDIFDFEDFDSNYVKFTPNNNTRLDVYARLYDGVQGHATSITIRVRCYISHSDTWVTLGYGECTSTSYQVMRLYLSGYLMTVEDVNNFKIKIDVSNIVGGGSYKGGIRVTYAVLHLEGTVKYKCYGRSRIGGLPGQTISHVRSIGVAGNDRILFNRACVYHEGTGDVAIFYKFSNNVDEGDWIPIGTVQNGFRCRYAGAANPSNPTEEELNSYVLGPVGAPLFVKWVLENQPLGQQGSMANFYIYYDYFNYLFNSLYYDKLREILTDPNVGVIPKYIEKILGTNESSGYASADLFNTDYIVDFPKAENYPRANPQQVGYSYLNFPYVDGVYVLNELVKLGSSIDYFYRSNKLDYRGLHWIVKCDNPYKLLIAPVGDHHVNGKNESCFIEDVWSTECPIGELVVSEDMIVNEFKHEVPLANYVLVGGKYKYPLNDDWTEDLTGWYEQHAPTTGIIVPTADLGLDNTHSCKGNFSLKYKFNLPLFTRMWGMLTRRINAEFTKLITRESSVYVNMKIYGEMKGEFIKLRFYCNDDMPRLAIRVTPDEHDEYEVFGNYFETDLKAYLTKKDNWNMIEIPITLEDLSGSSKTWTKHSDYGYPEPDWKNVKWIVIFIKTGQCFNPLGITDVWNIDDICIVGNVIRGVYISNCGHESIDDCKVGCIKHYGCRMYTVKDSLACTDTLDPNDMSRPLSQVALYELLRNRVPRMTGTVQIPLETNVLPGQIIHVKACKVGDAEEYKIDKDFRITKVTHRFDTEGAVTILELTDDLKNSLPVNTTDPYTTVIRAVNPDTQTKTFTSLKTENAFLSDLKPITKDISPY